MSATGFRRAATAWMGRYYFLLMSLLAALVIWPNRHEKTMSGIVLHYRDFKRIILNGFDPAAATEGGLPTFPMWGYGWLMLMTENRLVLVTLQTILAILTVWFTTRFLVRRLGQDNPSIIIFKVLVLVCIPWYAFHSALWPYSPASSCFVVSALLFVESCERSDLRWVQIMFSGLLFGLALNFRSDLIMLPFALAAGAVMLSGSARPSTAIKGGIWILCIFVMLVPWALYTKHVTGDYLWRSTNSGHVLFVGLGQLPDNKWGFTPKDEDPKMQGILDQRLGAGRSSLEHEGDKVLQAAFMETVLSEPWEYVRKCFYGLRLVLIYGFYQGGFFDDQSRSFHKNIQELAMSPTAFVNEYGRPSWRFGLEVVSKVQGLLLLWISFLLLPLTFFCAVKEKDIFRLVLVLSIAYQTGIAIFAQHLPQYTSTMLLFHIINIGVTLPIVLQRFQGRGIWHRTEGLPKAL